MDLDLRKLRYFAAVAEHRHFGRAAEQLFIAQPVLSRQVRALEQELGCALLVRTTRSVELTAAGEQLLDESRALLPSVDAAVARVLEADRGVDRLVVAFANGLHVSRAVRAFTAAHPGVAVDLLPVTYWEQEAPLRDGRAHVAFLRRQFDEDGMRVIPIGSDPRVACVPVGHRLARRRVIGLADLEGESILDAHARRTSTVEEKFELIAAGDGIAVVPRSVAEAYPRPDLVTVRVRDAEPIATCIVLPKAQRRRRVLDFVALATDALTDDRRLRVAR
ncbi:LysR family transcriptional regulator [Jatrophihabitans fulvus]